MNLEQEHPPFLFCADVGKETEKTCLSVGFDGVLHKPFRRSDLEPVMAQLRARRDAVKEEKDRRKE